MPFSHAEGRGAELNTKDPTRTEQLDLGYNKDRAQACPQELLSTWSLLQHRARCSSQTPLQALFPACSLQEGIGLADHLLTEYGRFSSSLAGLCWCHSSFTEVILHLQQCKKRNGLHSLQLNVLKVLYRFAVEVSKARI